MSAPPIDEGEERNSSPDAGIIRGEFHKVLTERPPAGPAAPNGAGAVSNYGHTTSKSEASREPPVGVPTGSVVCGWWVLIGTLCKGGISGII